MISALKNLLIKETVDDLIENVIDLSKDHEYFSRIKKDYCNPLISNTGDFSCLFRKAVKIPRLLTSLYPIAGSLKGMFSPSQFMVHRSSR